MFKWFKERARARREAAARHVEEVFREQPHPKHYLEMERKMRYDRTWGAAIDLFFTVVLVALFALSVKVWYVLEGFTVRW